MTYVQRDSARVNPKGDTSAERELLINILRTAQARSRLVTNTLETIGVSLRQNQITCEQARAWIAEEGLDHHLQLRKGGVA